LPLDQKCFQELLFTAFKNRTRSGFEDRQPQQTVSRIKWTKFSFFKLELLIFRRCVELCMKSTTMKQKYQMNLFFVAFLLFILLPKSMCELIHIRCIKTTAKYVHANEQFHLCLLILGHYFEVLDIRLWKLY